MKKDKLLKKFKREPLKFNFDFLYEDDNTELKKKKIVT